MWKDLLILWLKMQKLVNAFVLTILLRVSDMCLTETLVQADTHCHCPVDNTAQAVNCCEMTQLKLCCC